MARPFADPPPVIEAAHLQVGQTFDKFFLPAGRRNE